MALSNECLNPTIERLSYLKYKGLFSEASSNKVAVWVYSSILDLMVFVCHIQFCQSALFK